MILIEETKSQKEWKDLLLAMGWRDAWCCSDIFRGSKELTAKANMIALSGTMSYKMGFNPKDDCFLTSGMAGCFRWCLDNLNVRG